MKRQSTEWEKIFANDINSSYDSTLKKQTTRLKNVWKIWINIFSQRHTHCQQAHENMFNITNY